MGKIFLQITSIICINLLAFSLLGFILDALFGTDPIFLLVCVVISFIVFTGIMYKKASYFNREITKISIDNNNTHGK